MTSIGNYAFYGCSGLTSVTIPNSVTSIGGGTFSGCSGLTSVTIPNSVTSIGHNAFYNCSGLTSITIPNSVTSIGESAFAYCSGLTSVTIPNSVTSIGYSAFSGCSGMTSVTIPNSVTSIGWLAFCNCTGLTSVTIPNSVTRIYDSAFSGCTGLESITIPNSVTSIGSSAFYGTAWYNNQPDGVVYAGLNVYKYKGTMTYSTSITIEQGTISIGGSAFSGCSRLTSVTIPNSVTSIGTGAFNYCYLASVTVDIKTPLKIENGNTFSNKAKATLYVPAGCKSAYEAADYWKDFKEIIEMADPNIVFADANVKAICVANWDTDGDGELSYDEAEAVTSLSVVVDDNSVFWKNTSITSFDELQYFTGLTSIAVCAFEGCSSLTSITIPNSVTSIGTEAFKNCSSLTTIEIPSGVTSIEVFAFEGCSSLETISVEVENTKYDSRNNCNAIIEKSSNSLLAGCKNTVIPTNVMSIANGAFSGCSGLTSITIPNSVTSIGYSAFYSCSGLTSITIPNSVTSIGNSAFNDCVNLTSVTVDINTPLAITYNTFSNRANATLYVPVGSKSAYETADYWKEFNEIFDSSVSIAVNSLGKGTYCSEYPLDFTDVSGIYAYIISGFKPSAGNLIITRVFEVPAGTGLYIVGTPGNTYTIPVAQTDFYYSNMMKGVTVATTIPANEDGYTNYILASNGNGGAIFKRANNTQSPANRAYVQVPTSTVGAREYLGIETDDGSITGLDGVITSDTEEAEGDYYNLSGQKVQTPRRGIYIKNGKKVIIH